MIQTSCACTSCNPPSCFGNQSGITLYTPCPDFEVINVYVAQVLGGSHSSKQPHISWAEWLKSSTQPSRAHYPQQTSCMSPALSNPAPHLSNCQLFYQAPLILEVMSPGMSNRTRSLLPFKVPGSPEARVLPVEACVPPKPLGPLEAHVPPKPHGSLGDPSSSKAGPSQAKYLLNPPGC